MESRLRECVGELLDLVSSTATRFELARCTILSPLAEGADRLVAEEGLRRHFALTVPLPFPAEDYERDFPASAHAFRELLSQGTAIELGGSRGDEDEAYERAGHYVTDNCDLLLAIWDGRTTGLRGGTSAIIEHAAARSIPTCWISLDEARVRWLIGCGSDADHRGSSMDVSPAEIAAICRSKRRSSD